MFIHITHPWLTSSSVGAVQQRDTDVLKDLAKEFNLSYTAFGSAISTKDGPTAGALTLTEAWGTALEPAPVTPTDEDSAPWRLLSGTIKATFNAHRGLEVLTVRIIYSLVLGSCPETQVGVLVQSAVKARLTTQLWDVVHRYEVLSEPHTPHCPVQPPGWGKWTFTAERDSYRQ